MWWWPPSFLSWTGTSIARFKSLPHLFFLPPTLKHAPHVLIPPHAKEEKNHEETNQAFSPRSRFIFSLLPQLPAGRQARHHHLSLSLLAALVEVWASSPRSGDQEVAAVAGAGAHVAFGDFVAFSVR
ncbi:hypothetical protein C4D60_Mb04t10140 [Musa balbisiana]|uniref:Uncharacterized protein n=1 Tax=Musa balbisiana TaxID=52838 RepID=A0A4S8KAZ4_MUSBA|nr:hypothetical protein C4D60_Mb04t10140 [Musa balbisiana]